MASILIDGYNLGLEKGTGVATYARNLSYELKALNHCVSVLYGSRATKSPNALLREVAFFDNRDDKKNRAIEIAGQIGQAIKAPLGFSSFQIPVSGAVVANSFAAQMPRYDYIYNSPDVFKRSQSAFKMWGTVSHVTVPKQPDIAHWTYPIPVKIKNVPNIYTLHDLVPLRLPHTTLDNKKTYFKLLKQLSKTADHFVTVSECSKRDLITLLDIPAERITNTYQSVSIPDEYANKPEAQLLREVEGATGVSYKEYYLFWGSIEPKKNIGRMIEAYFASKVTAPLIIIGAQAWKSEGELQFLKDITRISKTGAKGESQRVIQLSYAPFSLLVSLIRGAKAALFPSLYEGFGLPALEAMLLGTPVICSNTASLPEVVGDAAIMVDPYNTSDISDAIRRIDQDADLRLELSARGKQRVALFSSEIYQARLDKIYRQFL